MSLTQAQQDAKMRLKEAREKSSTAKVAKVNQTIRVANPDTVMSNFKEVERHGKIIAFMANQKVQFSNAVIDLVDRKEDVKWVKLIVTVIKDGEELDRELEVHYGHNSYPDTFTLDVGDKLIVTLDFKVVPVTHQAEKVTRYLGLWYSLSYRTV